MSLFIPLFIQREQNSEWFKKFWYISQSNWHEFLGSLSVYRTITKLSDRKISRNILFAELRKIFNTLWPHSNWKFHVILRDLYFLANCSVSCEWIVFWLVIFAVMETLNSIVIWNVKNQCVRFSSSVAPLYENLFKNERNVLRYIFMNTFDSTCCRFFKANVTTLQDIETQDKF